MLEPELETVVPVLRAVPEVDHFGRQGTHCDKEEEAKPMVGVAGGAVRRGPPGITGLFLIRTRQQRGKRHQL